MVATASLLYRMGIDGDDKVKAAIAAVGTEEEKTAARAIAAADRKADRITVLERQIAAARAASAQADEKALAIVTGNSVQYEAARRREITAEGALAVAHARTGASAGQLKAGMQQLGFQAGDMATQWAANTPLMIIFSQQASQVFQAIGLMTDGAKGFLGVMGGPWGQLILAGVTVITSLTAATWANASASEGAAKAADSMGDAQSALGGIFDLTTGKIKSQNEALILNARLLAVQMRAEGAKATSDAQAAFAKTGQPTTGSELLTWLSARGRADPNAINAEMRQRAADQKRVLDAIASAKTDKARMDATAAAIKWGEGMSKRNGFSGLPLNEGQFRDAVVNSVTGPLKTQAADLIDKSLNSGTLDPSLRQDRKDRGGRKKKDEDDKAARITEQFNNQVERLQLEQLTLMGSFADSVNEQAKFALERLDIQRAAGAHEVAINKDLSLDRKLVLAGLMERNSQLERQKILWRLDDQLTDEELEQKRAANDNSSTLLRGDLEMARSQAERRRIQLEILKNEVELERATLEAVLAKHESTEVEKEIARKKLAQLDREAGQREAVIRRDTQGPFDRYRDRMNKTPEELGEQAEQIVVDELEYIHDQIGEGLAKKLGVKDPMFRAIIDLLLEQLLFKPLADALQRASQQGAGGGGGGGLLGGLLSGIGSLFGGGGGGAGGLQGLADGLANGAAGFATGTPWFRGGLMLTGEHGPEIVAAPRGSRVYNAGDTRRMFAANDAAPGISMPISIHAPGADAAALARVEAELAQLRREMPAIAVNAYADARTRRIIR